MESPYPERRRNTALLIGVTVLSALAAKELIQDNFKCEGSQTISVSNKSNPDSHFTIWSAIDDYVDFDPDNVNKQDIVNDIGSRNPNIDYSNLHVGDTINMPLSCTND